MTEISVSGFARIYETDLVYESGCWQRCGNAHCCNFSRHKSRFKMIAKTPFQELPLLPGEYEFLARQGWLEQFGNHERKVIEFPIDGHVIRAESIVSRRQGCACDHATRPTICRLYPLLPVFDIQGRLLHTEPMGIYEEMERIAGMEPECKLTSLPFAELNKYLRIATEVAKNPVMLFHIEAYRKVKSRVSRLLRQRCSLGQRDVFSVFETGLIRRSLVDTNELSSELSALARDFFNVYGDRFRLAKQQQRVKTD